MNESNKIDDDKGIPKLKSYLAAILNVKEKNLSFLPAYQGYLIFVESKNPFCLWVHKITIEGVLQSAFDLITEEFLYKLIWGGRILKEVIKGVIPDAPKNTLIFYPGLHRVNFGIMSSDSGSSGAILKGINKASGIVQQTGKELLNFISSTNNKDEKSESELEKRVIPKKTYFYIHFQDFLYTTLSKEKLFKQNLPNISSGLQFRTVFVAEAEDFIKKLEKAGFKTLNNGIKGII